MRVAEANKQAIIGYIDSESEEEEQKFSQIARIYPFTTENVAEYFQHLELQEKEILAVSGSGDHIFNAFFYRARRVDSFDTNVRSGVYT